MVPNRMILGLLLAGLLVSDPSHAKGPLDPFGRDEPLPEAAPSAVGMDASILEQLAQRIATEQKHKLHSVLVARRGRLVFEKYYNRRTRHTPHDIRSATKSITSLLTGIAIERGILPGLDAPVMDVLGDAYPAVEDKDALTFRHLLSMRGGLDCDDRDRQTRGQEDRMYRSRDWVGYFLALSPTDPPGAVGRYCTGGVVTLGEAIAQAAKEDVAAFAARALFDPLGIENVQWARFDGKTKVDTGGHLLITPQAMVKIGMLVLAEGRWAGKQVVPSSWVRLSTSEQAKLEDRPYGFLWWRAPARFADKSFDVVMAKGNGGQSIFVVPELDLVAVFTTGYYNSPKAALPDQIFYRTILPAVDEIQAHLSTSPDPAAK